MNNLANSAAQLNQLSVDLLRYAQGANYDTAYLAHVLNSLDGVVSNIHELLKPAFYRPLDGAAGFY